MDPNCDLIPKSSSRLYDHFKVCDSAMSVNSMLDYIPRQPINFQVTTNLNHPIREAGYLHLLGKSLSCDEYIAVSTPLKNRLVYVFQRPDELLFAFFNSYDTQPSFQTERVLFKMDSALRPPTVAYKDMGNGCYFFYCVASASVQNSLNCYANKTTMVCPEFLSSFQDKIATSDLYAVGTYGFANGGKRMALRKNDGSFELVQLNLTERDKLYSIGDLNKFE